MKNLRFFTILIENGAIFQNLKNVIRIFPWKFRLYFEIFISTEFGLGAPEASEFSKVFVEKSMETCNFLKFL